MPLLGLADTAVIGNLGNLAQLGAIAVWRNYREDPRQGLDAYLAAYEKWKGLVASEIGDDKEKFREALWREVYSKVDPESL